MTVEIDLHTVAVRYVRRTLRKAGYGFREDSWLGMELIQTNDLIIYPYYRSETTIRPGTTEIDQSLGIDIAANLSQLQDHNSKRVVVVVYERKLKRFRAQFFSELSGRFNRYAPDRLFYDIEQFTKLKELLPNA